MLGRNLQVIPPPIPAALSNEPQIPGYAANYTPPSTRSEITPGIIVTVLVLAIAVILSASLYLLLRFLRKSSSGASPDSIRHQHHLQRPNSRKFSPAEKNPLIDALPLFSYDSLSSRSNSSADCAVCLSKFEPNDVLRLLPICCHAFHAECIDTWLAANQSCPLCRSSIFIPESEVLGKFSHLRQNSLSNSASLSSSSRSFRVEIGNVSRRLPSNSGEIQRSYSISDSFDYILDNGFSEVPIGSFRIPSEFKAEPTAVPDDYGTLAAEIGPRGGWLKDYLSYSLSSSSRSFRGSGRWFFTGSSRRSTAELPPSQEPELDLEASQLSNDIGELFRWLSGV